LSRRQGEATGLSIRPDDEDDDDDDDDDDNDGG